MTPMAIEIRYPDLYWLADKDCFPELSDPDNECPSGKPKYSDKSWRKWGLIGEMVQAIGVKLMKGEFERKESESDIGIVVIDPTDFGQVDVEDIEIVESWFARSADCVLGDLEVKFGGVLRDFQAGGLKSGRRRLWNCWAVERKLLLPLQSEMLITASQGVGQEYRLSCCWAKGFLKVAPSVIIEKSPMYVEKLREYAVKCDV